MQEWHGEGEREAGEGIGRLSSYQAGELHIEKPMEEGKGTEKWTRNGGGQGKGGKRKHAFV